MARRPVIALFTALASLVTGNKVDSRLAMTGEITLRGAVLPIGGLKEKLLGSPKGRNHQGFNSER